MDERKVPREGELHSVVTIDTHSFTLRYGYNEEYERETGEPILLYPDLASRPVYTRDGFRIVSAIQSVCAHYTIPEGQIPENCCYTCVHYSNPRDNVGICLCEKQKQPSSGIGRKRGNLQEKPHGCSRIRKG